MQHHQPASNADNFLMQDEEQAILIIASRVLSYPPEAMDELRTTIDDVIQEQIESSDVQDDLNAAIEPLFNRPAKNLKEIYVSTFDLRSSLGLYLTAHEFGDSPKRGAALIKLQNIIENAGFIRDGDELADYIPMLLELMAVAPETNENTRLYKRLSVAIQRMLNNINPDNPYIGILQILMDHLFPKPTEEDISELENNREEADLEELPFPIMYQ